MQENFAIRLEINFLNNERQDRTLVKLTSIQGTL